MTDSVLAPHHISKENQTGSGHDFSKNLEDLFNNCRQEEFCVISAVGIAVLSLCLLYCFVPRCCRQENEKYVDVENPGFGALDDSCMDKFWRCFGYEPLHEATWVAGGESPCGQPPPRQRSKEPSAGETSNYGAVVDHDDHRLG